MLKFLINRHRNIVIGFYPKCLVEAMTIGGVEIDPMGIQTPFPAFRFKNSVFLRNRGR